MLSCCCCSSRSLSERAARAWRRKSLPSSSSIEASRVWRLRWWLELELELESRARACRLKSESGW